MQGSTTGDSTIVAIFILFYIFLVANLTVNAWLTVLQGRFPLTRFWLCTLTQVNFNHVNKIEARCKLFRLNVTLSKILLLRLRATFHTLPLFYLRT